MRDARAPVTVKTAVRYVRITRQHKPPTIRQCNLLFFCSHTSRLMYIHPPPSGHVSVWNDTKHVKSPTPFYSFPSGQGGRSSLFWLTELLVKLILTTKGNSEIVMPTSPLENNKTCFSFIFCLIKVPDVFFLFSQILNRWTKAKFQFCIEQEIPSVGLWSFQGRWKETGSLQRGWSPRNCTSNNPNVFLGSWVTKGNLSTVQTHSK